MTTSICPLGLESCSGGHAVKDATGVDQLPRGSCREGGEGLHGCEELTLLHQPPLVEHQHQVGAQHSVQSGCLVAGWRPGGGTCEQW